MDNRKHMGKAKEGVVFPVAPNISEMSDTYLNFIDKIKCEIEKQRFSVVLSANASMICLYWNIGKAILNKQTEEGWGSKVIDRMSKDLKDAFPDMSGFSPRNIKYMRKFAEIWEDYEFVQRTVAQIPWRSNIVLMDKLSSKEERIWYAQKTLENGWSRDVLALQVQSRLIERSGKSVNNFEVALPPVDSDMANQIFKDPCQLHPNSRILLIANSLSFVAYNPQNPPVLLSPKSVCLAWDSPFPASAVAKGITH